MEPEMMAEVDDGVHGGQLGEDEGIQADTVENAAAGNSSFQLTLLGVFNRIKLERIGE
jgi:hypothetical protein